MVKFFEPGNFSDLAEKVIELAQDDKMRQQQINNSLEFLKMHGWEETKKKYHKIIDNIVAP
jgi:glycosyltransferase involved in cell wall biosynthesis